jgi:hypothetical protein
MAMTASQKVAKLKATIIESVRQGAIAYAIGRAGKPIVDQHFTEGNQQRYGWEPLSRDYFLRKRGQIPNVNKRQNFKGSRLDKNAEFKSSTGTLTGIGSGTNLPMLVNSGDLRKRTTGKGHGIKMVGGTAVITFTGLPEYATYLHEGTGKMPQRSPVLPNEFDKKQVIEVMKAYLRRVTGGSDRHSISSI